MAANELKTIARIGREPTAGERGMQLLLEESGMREHVAMNLYGAAHGLWGRSLRDRWAGLSSVEREALIDEAIRTTRAFADALVETRRPDDDGPGESVPFQRTA